MSVVMVVVMMVVLVLVILLMGAADLLHELLGQGVAALHGGDDLGPGELVPGGGEDGGLGVFLPQQLHGSVQLALIHALGTGEEDSGGVLHLVVEELAEVFHIDTGLGGVHHGDEAVELQLRSLFLYPSSRGAPPSRTRSTAAMTSDSLPTPEGSMMMRSGA